MQSNSPSQIFGVSYETPIMVAVFGHILLWSLGPAILLGNLHTDSLEAAYWGHDWVLGYSKHPPLTSWLLDSVLHIPVSPLFTFMLLSQVTVGLACLFIWQTIRLYASRQTAALGAFLYVLAPAANIYAVQINHNSMLAPFFAATLYFGLSYLEEGRWTQAVALGLSVGFGAVTKYEIAFAVVPLLLLTVMIPRFRSAYSNPKSYIAVAIAVLIFMPHLLWLAMHNWSSFARAMGEQRIDSLEHFNTSVINALIGAVALVVVPSLLLLSTHKLRTQDDDIVRPDRELIAFVIFVAPIIGLLIMSFATWQVLKPLWVLPLTSSTVIGLALFFPAGSFGDGLSETRSARLLLTLTATAFAGFILYLAIAAGIGRPLTAYSAHTEIMAQDALSLWRKHSTEPLSCVIINERKMGAATAMWLHNQPVVLDMTSPEWVSSPQRSQCLAQGGIAVLLEPSDDPRLQSSMPQACVDQKVDINIQAKYMPSPFVWQARLIYVPAAQKPNCAVLQEAAH